ncbi:uncharacterized protein LOC112966523 isoform X2 [Apteryx rowi]|uniref:uncharacterized protein LOC112966523 isoform X2 n=1 Tax=Apteryx rowi TaxID=308060 RepID=UPI000E1CD5F2|nr:uncharacterized protein LOC112966523 isoform X2 [Apteryx rowi]
MVRRGRAGVSGCPEHTHCAHSTDGGRGTRGRPPPRPRTIYTRPAPTRPHRTARHAPTARSAQAPPQGKAERRAAPAPGRGERYSVNSEIIERCSDFNKFPLRCIGGKHEGSLPYFDAVELNQIDYYFQVFVELEPPRSQLSLKRS